MNKNLYTVRNTSKDLNTSAVWVYKLIGKNQIDSFVIDGIIFVVWNDKYKQYKLKRNKS